MCYSQNFCSIHYFEQISLSYEDFYTFIQITDEKLLKSWIDFLMIFFK